MKNSILPILQEKEIILASQSPRRQELLTQMGLQFSVQVLAIDESYPSELKKAKITEFITEKKAHAFGNVADNQHIITADTIVWHKGKCLEKPKNEEDAVKMLMQLSNSKHSVYSSVAIKTKNQFLLQTDKVKVYFDAMTLNEINFYVERFKPYDKAGSYGIQDWIGLCKIAKIKGSYFTVMGLPMHLLYKMLLEIK